MPESVRGVRRRRAAVLAAAAWLAVALAGFAILRFTGPAAIRSPISAGPTTTPPAPVQSRWSPAPPGATASAPDGLRRAPRLPAPVGSNSCPFSRLSTVLPAIAPALGTGPVRLVSPGGALIQYAPNPQISDEWGLVTVEWLVRDGTGPALLRGHLLGPHLGTDLSTDGPDGSGPDELVGFDLSADGGRESVSPARESLLPPATGRDGWTVVPGYLRFRTPGCYGIQIDTPAGTSTIVIYAIGRDLRGWPPVV